MLNLTAGQAYRVVIRITNSSTRGGAPAGTQLTVGIFATTEENVVVLIPRTETPYQFGPSERKDLAFEITAPLSVAGSIGYIEAWVKTPEGLSIARGSVDLVVLAPIPETPIGNLYGIVRDTAGLPIAGVQVNIAGFVAYTDGNGAYRINGIEANYYTIQLIRDGFEGYSSTVQVYEGENELNVTMLPVAPPPAPAFDISGTGTYIVEAAGWRDPDLTFTIRNTNPGALTRTLQLWMRRPDGVSIPISFVPGTDWQGNVYAPYPPGQASIVQITLPAGGSIQYRYTGYYQAQTYQGLAWGWWGETQISRPGTPRIYTFWLQDENGAKSQEVNLTILP